MNRTGVPLSQLEATTLIQIRLRANLEPRYRPGVTRLIHLALVEETPQGFQLTKAGEERFRVEARKAGLPLRDGS
jgi:hypothetical protein